MRRPRQPNTGPILWQTLATMDTQLVALTGRLRVTGSIPRALRTQPLLLAANHISVFDPFVMIAACRRIGITPRFLVASGILDAPVVGRPLRASGHLSIDRAGNNPLEQLAEIGAELRASRSPIVVYPEGRVTHDPGLWPERGKTGAARVALEAGVPVIPVSQWGAHETVCWGKETISSPTDVLPQLRSGLTAPLRRPTYRVHFGEPVNLSEFSDNKPGDAVRAHGRIMQAITDGLVPLRAAEPDRPRVHDPTRPTDTRSPWRPNTRQDTAG